MKTTYKGYSINKTGSDRFHIKANGKYINTIHGSLSCTQYYIDNNLEPLNEPTDQYADLDLSEELPSSEVVNESEGVTCCPLLKLLDDTKDQVQGDQPEPTFEAKMLAYYDDSFSAMIVEPPHHLS